MSEFCYTFRYDINVTTAIYLIRQGPCKQRGRKGFLGSRDWLILTRYFWDLSPKIWDLGILTLMGSGICSFKCWDLTYLLFYHILSILTWDLISLRLGFGDLDTPFFPLNMPLVASTGPVLVRCWQHRPSTGPILAHNGMSMGLSRDVGLGEIKTFVALI